MEGEARQDQHGSLARDGKRPNADLFISGTVASPISPHTRTTIMDSGMTLRAKGNEVFLGIFPLVAAKLLMMDFQVRHRAARLAAPAIAA